MVDTVSNDPQRIKDDGGENMNNDNSETHQQNSNDANTNITGTTEEFFKSPDFYTNAKRYWANIEPTIDGMLGGLSVIDRTDIAASTGFLRDLQKMKPPIGCNRALDCGAGIGRVTKNLLVKFFDTVDLVEQDAAFVTKAEEYLQLNGTKHPNVGEIFNEGLQSFVPKPGYYDVIWSQWVLGHLTDADLQAFFERCAIALKPNGCLVIKENFTANDDCVIDTNDSSVTRPLRIVKDILMDAGFRPVKTSKQMNFIDGLFPVYMLACKSFRKPSAI